MLLKSNLIYKSKNGLKSAKSTRKMLENALESLENYPSSFKHPLDTGHIDCFRLIEVAIV